METIQEAKKYLMDNWEQGVKCPCCNQNVKLYKCALRATIAIALIKTYQIMERENKTWVHIMQEVKPANGNYAKLRFWGLLAPKGDIPENDTKARCYWSVTDKGRDFLQGRISVPSHILVFDNQKFGSLDGTTDIKQALGKKFSWTELMGDLIQDNQQGSLL